MALAPFLSLEFWQAADALILIPEPARRSLARCLHCYQRRVRESTRQRCQPLAAATSLSGVVSSYSTTVLECCWHQLECVIDLLYLEAQSRKIGKSSSGGIRQQYNTATRARRDSVCSGLKVRTQLALPYHLSSLSILQSCKHAIAIVY